MRVAARDSQREIATGGAHPVRVPPARCRSAGQHVADTGLSCTTCSLLPVAYGPGLDCGATSSPTFSAEGRQVCTFGLFGLVHRSKAGRFRRRQAR
jgi:hypothetical protein